MFSFAFEPQATAADIASFLAANKLSIVEGPSGGELYRVRVAATKLAKPELTDIVKKLQRRQGHRLHRRDGVMSA